MSHLKLTLIADKVDSTTDVSQGKGMILHPRRAPNVPENHNLHNGSRAQKRGVIERVHSGNAAEHDIEAHEDEGKPLYGKIAAIGPGEGQGHEDRRVG